MTIERVTDVFSPWLVTICNNCVYVRLFSAIPVLGLENEAARRLKDMNRGSEN